MSEEQEPPAAGIAHTNGLRIVGFAGLSVALVLLARWLDFYGGALLIGLIVMGTPVVALVATTEREEERYRKRWKLVLYWLLPHCVLGFLIPMMWLFGLFSIDWVESKMAYMGPFVIVGGLVYYSVCVTPSFVWLLVLCWFMPAPLNESPNSQRAWGVWAGVTVIVLIATLLLGVMYQVERVRIRDSRGRAMQQTYGLESWNP